MASQTTNVLRHTALVTGLFYGLFHARTVQTEYEHRVLAERENHKDDLMHKAKEAFKAAKAKKDSPLTKGPISDPEDPKFDLEALINYAAGETIKN